MSAKSYEDLKVWQSAFELTKRIYQISREGDFERDFALRNQIRRAAISTMANIAEGFARATDREFIRFLDIARSSAIEVQALLHLALALAYVSQDAFDKLYDLCERIRAGITSLIRHLRSKKTD